MTRIASLGSSFAAGIGIAPQVDGAAGRSGANYAHLLAHQLGAALTDLSVSGATLLNLLSEPQRFRGGSFPAQIDGLPEDADLVLVLGGGNDVKYIGGMIFASLEASWAGWAVMKAVQLLGLAGEDQRPADEETMVQRFGAVLDAVHAKAPKAQVVVIEYLTLLGNHVRPLIDVPFDQQAIEKYRAVASSLQKATAAAANARSEWCKIVHTAELSQNNGLGSKEPWVGGFGLGPLWRREVWYHPNARGMEAVAEILREQIIDAK